MTKTCVACGTSFETQHPDPERVKYCSPRCRWRLVKSGGTAVRPIERRCVVCGAAFMSRSRSAQREKFCSPRCRAKHWNAIMAKRPRPRWTRAARRCQKCGAEYMPTTPRQRWCGAPCRMRGSYEIEKARKAEERQAPKVCVECGESFTPNAFIGQRQTYCSRRCSTRVASRTRYAGMPPNERNRTIPREIRHRVLARAGHRCELCRSVQSRYDIHHRDWNYRNNADGNLMALCRACHAAMEVRCRVEDGRLVLTSLQWQWFPPEAIVFRLP